MDKFIEIATYGSAIVGLLLTFLAIIFIILPHFF